MSDSPLIMFVCWGNICRSPMAERVARSWAVRDGVRGVSFASAGVSDEEHGSPIDQRAAAVLKAAGYDPSGHHAHRITVDEIHRSGLLIGMEEVHLARIRQLVPHAEHLYLLSDFDPNAAPGSGIPDPWYGPDAAFDDTLKAIEAAMPEVMKRAQELLRQRS
ncbi:MAG: low molecular weight protein-tyrosine-phosphatase [Propionicimonas sp.]|uniref:low molecular weight protein-tyrosine-phosphatase n=1 Tax=Propionicimonas sp. TaxID=1955623 RepID=UPI002B1EE42D|nr:low molecular weight protein-tyrosine-phosphatase [Propionicimonas sp.]MEA4943916.1 low molecular weight protein-tyrosine-phosphatase [Propionicimonas sp.]MEA5051820.1 low molecular weight protein-tyrosine-phosphatase [Propionicimonas sp.]MEA5119205.1 low molecular weight protein-tyrosine-phosphatase [Propionicimonas sp.]